MGWSFLALSFLGVSFFGWIFFGLDFLGSNLLGGSFLGRNFLGVGFSGSKFLGLGFLWVNLSRSSFCSFCAVQNFKNSRRILRGWNSCPFLGVADSYRCQVGGVRLC